MHPLEADGAGPPQARTACLARARPFEAGAARLLRLKRLGGFPLPGRLERLVLWLRPDRERPSGIALLRADTLRHGGAAPTILA